MKSSIENLVNAALSFLVAGGEPVVETKVAKAALLRSQATITVKGCIRNIKIKNLGAGVVRMYLEKK